MCRNCQQLKLECVFVKSHRGGRRNPSKSSAGPQAPSSASSSASSSVAVGSAQTNPSLIPKLQLPYQSMQVDYRPPPYPMMGQPTPPSAHEDENNANNAHAPYHLPPLSLTTNTPPHPPTTGAPGGPGGHVNAPPPPAHQAPQAPPPPPPPPHGMGPGPSAPGSIPPQSANGGHGYLTATSQIIMDMNDRIADLQARVAWLTKNYNGESGSGGAGAGPKPPLMWDSSEQELAQLDLPPFDTLSAFIEVYYSSFHVNYPFLFPKQAFFRYIRLRVDTSLVHAMCSVACRYLTPGQVPMESFMYDPRYWIANSKKYLDYADASTHAKVLVVIGLGLYEEGLYLDARQYFTDARRIIHLQRLDKLHDRNSLNPSYDRKVEVEAMEASTASQLLHRESLIRTIWICWGTQVMLCALLYRHSEVPYFESNLSLPVANQVYTNQLEGWTKKPMYWSDFETALLSGDTNSPSFYDVNFFIASVQLLATIIRQKPTAVSSIQVSTRQSLDARLRNLESYVPPVTSTYDDRSVVFSRIVLYFSAFTMHSSIVRPALVFSAILSRNIEGEPDTKPLSYEEQSIDVVFENLRSSKSSELTKAYAQCVWAAHGLKSVLYPGVDLSEMKVLVSYWKTLPNAIAYLAQFSISLLANELLLKHYAARKDNTPVSTADLDNELNEYMEYINFASSTNPKFSSCGASCRWLLERTYLRISQLPNA